MKADGTIIIDTKINTDGVEVGTNEVKEGIDRMALALRNADKTVLEFIDKYEKGILESAGETNEFRKEIKSLESQLEALEAKGLYFGDEEYDQTYLKLKKVEQALSDYKKELLSPTPDAKIFDPSTLEGKIESLENKIVKLREQGKGFGDEVFDSTYKSLVRAQEELKEYRKNLTKKEEPIQLPVVVDTTTLEGQINLLKAKLEGLRNEGKGFGDEAFDSTALSLKRAEQALAEYKNELFKTDAQRQKEAETARKQAEKQEELNRKLQETKEKEEAAAMAAIRLEQIGRSAQVSTPQIVQMRNELSLLLQRQKELEKAGVGLGTVEYDENIRKINQLQEEINDYRKSLTKAKSSQEDFNKSIKSTTKSSSSGNRGLGRMLATGLLMGMVFQGVYAIMGSMKEGMDNLAQYSEETNSTLSGLSSSLLQLKNSFATAFSPILTAIAPALNYLIGLLSSAATAVAQLMAVLTGKSTFVKATKVQKDYAASLKGTGSAAADAGDEAKKALAPFDDLVQIQQNQSTSGSGGGGGAGEVSPGEMFEEVQVSNNLVSALDKIKAAWQEAQSLLKAGFEIGFSNTEGLSNIQQSLENIKKISTEIFTAPEVQNAALEWARTILYNIGLVTGSMASVGITIAENITGGIELYLTEAKQRIQQYIVSMFDISGQTANIVGGFSTAFAQIFEVFGDENGQRLTASIIGMFNESFMGVTELAAKLGRDVVDLLLTPFTESAPQLEIAFDGILGVLATSGETIKEIFRDTFEKLNTMYDEHIKPMFDAFTAGFTNIYQHALEAFNTYILPVMQKGADKFDEFKNKHLQPLINKFIDLAGQVADVVRVIWTDNLEPFLIWAIDTFSPILGGVLEGIMLAFWDVAGVVADVVTGMLSALEDVLDFLENVFKGDWEAAWNDVKNIFKNVFNGIIQLAEDAINFIIDSLNKLSFDVPDWVPEIGGATFGFDISHVSLPRLASGTVIPPRAGEFAAILGDNNREAEVVSPISTIKQALLEAMQEAGGSGGEQTITLRFDGSMAALARVLKPELDREAARKGTKLVIVGGR